MRAWIVDRPGPISTHPLRLIDKPDPEPGPGEVRLRVSACGICRTDLHLAEGDLPPRRHGVVPGHEAVGEVDKLGPGARRFQIGDRIGVAWLASTCSTCRFCTREQENLCTASRFVGWDIDGGYAEQVVVPEDYAYFLPAGLHDEKAAPLLCAGIIGYRALMRSRPKPGTRLAIYGFGASAHLAAQVAVHMGIEVHVRTRSPEARNLALRIGAASAGDSFDPLQEPAASAILFAPSGDLVPVALEALDRGGTLAVAGIYLSDTPRLSYRRHLFQEKQLVSVTANTRRDGEEFLRLAPQIPIEVTTTGYGFPEADKALEDLAADRMVGAGVLRIGGS